MTTESRSFSMSVLFPPLVEYPAFIVGWTSGLLYQLAASAVVVRWSHYVVHFIELISDHNITKSIVEAPIAWSKTSDTFYVTGQVINVPSIAIGIFVTVILFLGIRETSMVNLVLVIFKIVILLIFIFAGCVYVDTDNYRPFFPKNEGMAMTWPTLLLFDLIYYCRMVQCVRSQRHAEGLHVCFLRLSWLRNRFHCNAGS